MDLNGDFAMQAARSITAAGGKAIGVTADITKPDQVQSAVTTVLSEFGAIHVLVNDAAISDRKPFLEASLPEWQMVLDVVLTGTFIVSQAVARQMVQQGQGGAIVNIVSTSGHAGETARIAYGTAKSGLLNFTRSLALQLAPYGIRVNSVTPSTTGTRVGDPGGRPREEGPAPSTRTVPLGRWGRPRDQAEAVLFLASPAADFITGINIPVDGGNLAGRAGGGG
jgi:3-oxoacyl-[acyl-carrier protein] reductase